MTDDMTKLAALVADGIQALEERGTRTDGMEIRFAPALAETAMGRLTTLFGMRVVVDETLPPGQFRLAQPLEATTEGRDPLAMNRPVSD